MMVGTFSIRVQEMRKGIFRNALMCAVFFKLTAVLLTHTFALNGGLRASIWAILIQKYGKFAVNLST